MHLSKRGQGSESRCGSGKSEWPLTNTNSILCKAASYPIDVDILPCCGSAEDISILFGDAWVVAIRITRNVLKSPYCLRTQAFYLCIWEAQPYHAGTLSVWGKKGRASEKYYPEACGRLAQRNERVRLFPCSIPIARFGEERRTTERSGLEICQM